MNYLLIKLEANWADEFDVDCLWVTTEKAFEEWKEDMSKRDIAEDIEIYFGTNEFVSFESYDYIMQNLTVEPITQAFYVDFTNMIGETFGLVDLKYLPECYEYLDEE
jgi:hypothetical protein